MSTQKELLDALDKLYDAEQQEAFYLIEQFIKDSVTILKVPYLQRKPEGEQL